MKRMTLFWQMFLFFLLLFYGLSCLESSDSMSISTPTNAVTLPPFVQVYQNIFSTTCAAPACHDGHFEPDFRTLQSSYFTLVYHPITKNNRENAFKYRVVPFDTAQSVLHERLTNCCFVNADDRMPQSTIGDPLSQKEIDAVTDWILEGAKDMYGNTPQLLDLKPSIGSNFTALDPHKNIFYSDSLNRLAHHAYDAMILPQETQVLIHLHAFDDNTPPHELLDAKLKWSYTPDDFSAASFIPSHFETDKWVIPLNTADYLKDSIVYLRFYIRDASHEIPTEYPSNNEPTFKKREWSFIVKS